MCFPRSRESLTILVSRGGGGHPGWLRLLLLRLGAAAVGIAWVGCGDAGPNKETIELLPDTGPWQWGCPSLSSLWPLSAEGLCSPQLHFSYAVAGSPLKVLKGPFIRPSDPPFPWGATGVGLGVGCGLGCLPPASSTLSSEFWRKFRPSLLLLLFRFPYSLLRPNLKWVVTQPTACWGCHVWSPRCG